MIVLNNRKGLALPMVIIIVAIVMILCTAAIFVVNNQQTSVSNSRITEDALHIAEAGYYKYLWYLNDNSDFYKATVAGNEFKPTSTYTESDNKLWAGYPKEYAPIEYKSGNAVVGFYQISIVPPSGQQPVLTVTSTGWTADDADHKRILEVKIHKRLFTDYLDFSGDSKTPDGDPVYWGDETVVYGPVFTNGILRTNGTPEFNDEVTYVEGTEYKNGKPIFKKAGQPQKGTPLVFPSSNKDLVYWAAPAKGGYEYNGRTCIYLDNNKLQIRNVNTNSDGIAERILPTSGVIHINGDLFISGILDGRLTIVTEGDIFITGKDPTNFNFKSAQEKIHGIIYAASWNSPDKTFTSSCDDMLGMISNKRILIDTRYWPVQGSNSSKYDKNGGYAVKNMYLQAAIMGLSSDSYYGVDEYSDLNDMGTLFFAGSKIFNRIGATYTGTGNNVHGYRGSHAFDYRLIYQTPPHFIEPANAGWEVKEWKEKASSQ